MSSDLETILPACPNGHSSAEVIKRGVRQTKKWGAVQLFLCKTCGLRFSERSGDAVREREQLMHVTLDLAEKGLSTAQIMEHLKKFYGFTGTRQLVYRWIVDFGQDVFQRRERKAAVLQDARKVYVARITRLQAELGEMKKKLASRIPISTQKPIEMTPCPRCGSKEVGRRGHRETRRGRVQLYKCKQCGYKFKERDAFVRKQSQPSIISLAFGLSFSGASLRDISEQLYQSFGVEVRASTIDCWIDEYVPKVAKFLRDVRVNGGEVWQMGTRKILVGGVYRPLWVVLDCAVGVILAARVTSNVDVPSAIEVLKEARRHTSGTPNKIETDEWGGYEEAISAVFGSASIHSPPKPGAGFTHINKLTAAATVAYSRKLRQARGFDTIPSAQIIVDGSTIHFNFVRSLHSSNRTPAEVGNAPVELGRDRWLSLIEIADKVRVNRRAEG